MSAVVVPEAFVEQMFELDRDSCRRVGGLTDDETLSLMRAIATSADSGWSLIEAFVPKFRDPKVLEVGSGYGVALCGLLARGLDARGIEPGRDPFEGRYDFAVKLLESNKLEASRLVAGVAESLPFADESFDIVYSSAVIEHVQDPSKAMDEMARVLKPGGVMITHVPNYHAFYEGHYRIPWVPYVLRSKRVAKLYVEHVHHRDPSFVDTLNFVSHGWFEKWASARKTSLRQYPPLPLLGRFNRALELAEHELTPTGSLAEWIRRRHPAARTALSASCKLVTSAVFSLGLGKEITVVWWKTGGSSALKP